MDWICFTQLPSVTRIDPSIRVEPGTVWIWMPVDGRAGQLCSRAPSPVLVG